MHRLRRTSPGPIERRIGVAGLLGLIDFDDEAVARGFAERIEQVSAIWPLVVTALFILCAAMLAAAGSGTADRIDAPLIAAATVTGASALIILATLRLPGAAALSAHLRHRAVSTASAGLAAGMMGLLFQAMSMAESAANGAAFVAVAGGIIIVAIALHPLRSATLGLIVGLSVTLGMLAGAGIVFVVAVAVCAVATVEILRLARIDRHVVMTNANAAREGRLATKMIAEFEGHGTGWFWETDQSGRITYLSAKVAAEVAAFGGDPIGRSVTDIFAMDSATPGTERTLGFHLSSRTSFADYSVRATGDPDPERLWSISGRPVVDDLDRFRGFIGLGTDLTEKRRSEVEIQRLALFDGLTGLANRQRMRQSLEKLLAQSDGQYRPTGLLLLDLDRFKAVNDTLGHQAGDALLIQVAERLQRVVGDAGLVGRLGGDEFEILLSGADRPEPLAALAQEIIGTLSRPYFVAATSVTIGCSIGIAVAPSRGPSAESLFRDADLALYAAKGDGRGVYRFYADAMLAGAKSRKQLEDDLREALAGGGFYLNYQPVVSTKDARVVGYEALIRWDHAERGAIAPADFIPVAEECGLIEGIGEWVLRTACHEAARWPRDVRVAVNVSPIQFANPALPGIVTSALAASGLAPGRLELEITESVFLNDAQSTDQMFRSLKGLGVRLALDDFGTGYSSLGYLKTAPFDKIKIDQSFVRGAVQHGNRNAAIIKAIVTLADTLDMETTAEGVEAQDEIELVRSLGCSHIQGYVYGRAMSHHAVRAMLGDASDVARASGFKLSRAPRIRMLRSARIAVGSKNADVRIRDISSGGALIDGINIPGMNISSQVEGVDLLIELVENQMVAAKIRWADKGRAGIEFAERFDLGLLGGGSAHAGLRRAG